MVKPVLAVTGGLPIGKTWYVLCLKVFACLCIVLERYWRTYPVTQTSVLGYNCCIHKCKLVFIFPELVSLFQNMHLHFIHLLYIIEVVIVNKYYEG